VLPAASVARTSNVCGPSLRPEYARGLAHGTKPAPSSRHWNPVTASLAVNVNVATVAFVGSTGFCPIATDGPVASMVQV
jgi:hypothetical protein